MPESINFMHAEGVRVRITTPTLINLPSSRLLYARWEGLREGEPCETLPSLKKMRTEGVRVRIPPLINLPSSRLLYARQEGLREGASYDPRPNLLRSG